MKLTQLMDKKPIDIDLNFISEYKHGIKVWSHAMLRLNFHLSVCFRVNVVLITYLLL